MGGDFTARRDPDLWPLGVWPHGGGPMPRGGGFTLDTSRIMMARLGVDSLPGGGIHLGHFTNHDGAAGGGRVGEVPQLLVVDLQRGSDHFDGLLRVLAKVESRSFGRSVGVQNPKVVHRLEPGSLDIRSDRTHGTTQCGPIFSTVISGWTAQERS
eukprot:1192004-Prorocentrum_minimum.AAC.2